jgi:hypothetical protein
MALALAVMLGGIPARADDLVRAGKPHVYGLYSSNKSGEFGTVTLTPIVGSRTEVDVALVGASDEELQPVNIYAGSCAKLDPHPKYALNYAVSGVSQTLLHVQATALTAGGLAINVHKSTSDVEMYTACGDIARK